jgi:ATP-dependent DNA helicase RecQ
VCVHPSSAHRLLEKHFGFSSFRPGQEPLVAAGISGRDALGVLPTGGGKSLCYQVPFLALPGLTLVLRHLISLM